MQDKADPPGIAFAIESSQMLNPEQGKANGMVDGASGSIAMVAKREIPPGHIVLEEMPALQGGAGIVYGAQDPLCKVLFESFLRLPRDQRDSILGLCQKALTKNGGRDTVGDEELLQLLARDGVMVRKNGRHVAASLPVPVPFPLPVPVPPPPPPLVPMSLSLHMCQFVRRRACVYMSE